MFIPREVLREADIHRNFSITIYHQIKVSYITNQPTLMSDLTFSVFRWIFQAVLTSTSSATNWTGVLDFFLHVEVSKFFKTTWLAFHLKWKVPQSLNQWAKKHLANNTIMYWSCQCNIKPEAIQTHNSMQGWRCL